MKPNPHPHLLTSADVRDLAQIPVRKIRALVKAGILPAIKISPRCLRFDPQALEAALEALKTEGKK
jgi:hypothetical protein